MRQTSISKQANVKKEWLLIDAAEENLGHLAAFTASILRGKHKATFTPNVDMGDNVVIINAEKVKLDPAKIDKKIYYTHSGYPGGLRARTVEEQRTHKPTSLVEKAIKGMIPNTSLGRRQLHNLYVYAGPEHKQEAQKPRKIEVKS